MSSTPSPTVVCRFYRRAKVADGHRYDLVYIGGPESRGCLITPHPPAVGDTIFLSHRAGGPDLTGYYVVVAREWHHASWGSAIWPILEQFSDEGPLLEVIVEPAPAQRGDAVIEPDYA